MTISEDFGKFKTKLQHKSVVGFGYREREVELQVMWHSCGIYQLSYYRPREAEEHDVMVVEDWYPPNTDITFTPEQFEKVAELYPSAPKQERYQCYKPFYEDYLLSIGMFDFGDDRLFQAFKDPYPDVERVYMATHYFSYGAPTTNTSVLGLYWDDFKRLKEFLDSKKDQIFYSGCKISWPSPNLTAIAGHVEDIQKKNE